MNNYLSTISPYIRLAQDSFIPNQCLLERVIFDYELLFVKDGHCTLTFEDRIYNGQPGDIFIIRPKVPHKIEVNKDHTLHQPHIHFDLFEDENSQSIDICLLPYNQLSDVQRACFRDDINITHGAKLPERIRLSNTQHFEVLLFDIIDSFRSLMPYHMLEVKGKFIQLWSYLLSEIYKEKNKQNFRNKELMGQLKHFIEQKYNIPLTLEDLESEFKYSKYMLSKEFKAIYQISPIKYHNHIRIDKAKELLLYSGLNISEIADQLGYPDVHSFSRAFKRITGVSPSKLI